MCGDQTEVHSEKTLQKIAKADQVAPFLAHDTGYVRSPDVAAATLADVDAL
jgi:hypothetical protein